jgi:hypothetical protein
MKTMTTANTTALRYFLTYRGVKLPLCLSEELMPEALTHRNTYFQAAFDAGGRVAWLEKMVYGEVEMRHDYRYDDQGTLREAVISMPDELPQTLHFND